MSELLVQMLTSSIATLKKKVVDQDEKIPHLKNKNKACKAEQVEQERLCSDLILSLQATISNLEVKVSALRKSEATASSLVAAYSQLLTSTRQAVTKKTTRVLDRWDETAIQAMVAKLDLLERR